MSVDIKLKNIQLKLLEEFQFLLPKEELNVIIPYVPSGYQDFSNLGNVSGQYNIDNFLTYKRLYTGNDAFIITWKGSTSIDENLDANGQIKINWNIGEYILGFNEGVSSDVGIENDASFSDYKKHSVSNTLTFRIRADEYNLDENYKYLFYKVPEISKDILYRVVSLETEYSGRIPICYVLTLQSLQQDLENTGKAKSQNVMSNAPGQGYYDPKIVENPKDEEVGDNINWVKIDKTRWITIDYDKVWNNPVKKVVVKMFGFGMFMNFTMVGRKMYSNQSFLDYGIPRLIFPINYKQATTPTLYRTQQAEDNFYFVYSMFPTIAFTQDVFKAMKDFMDINKVWTNQGVMYINSGDIKQTNPIQNEKYQYSLFGQITNVGGTEVYIPWLPTLNREYSVDTRGVYGCAPTYTIKQEQRAIHDRLWDSYWTQKQLARLPIRKENTITFGSLMGTGALGIFSGNIVSMISGAILFDIGLFGTIFTQLPNKTLDFGLSGILPCSITDFMLNEASVSLPNLVAGKEYFKLNYFLNDNDQELLTFFNTQTINTSFEASLTDLFKKDGVVYETTLIGQSKKEDGTNIFDDERQLLVSGGEELQEIDNSQEGFIIDSFNLQSLFKGDFSVEFLDKDSNVIWSGVYQSEAKWTNSIREINTWRNTSIYGRENIFLKEPKPWPKKMELAPWKQPIVEINIPSKMKEFVIYGITDRADTLQDIQRYYDGVIENHFNNTEGGGFTLGNQTYNSGGKPWIRYSNSQSRLSQYTIKDKILETSGTITKEAFFQAYENIRYKINMIGLTIEEIAFDENSDAVVTKTYEVNKKEVVSPIGITKRTGTGLSDSLYVSIYEKTRIKPSPTTDVYIDYYYGPNQVFNITSTLTIEHKLIFEDDGVYIESTVKDKKLKIEVDYIEMSNGFVATHQGTIGGNLWDLNANSFGKLTKEVGLWNKLLWGSAAQTTKQFVDSFSIGRILANKK